MTSTTRPRIVCLCGSTRFMKEMIEADERETAAGRIVVRPGCDLKTPNAPGDATEKTDALKARLDALHRAKIDLADEVLVVGDYIGTSTRAEIAYARTRGIPVRYTHPHVTPTAPDESAGPAGQGWDRADFRCGRCGARRAATTETEYTATVAAHQHAHTLWDRLTPAERRALTEAVRIILGDLRLSAEWLQLIQHKAQEEIS